MAIILHLITYVSIAIFVLAVALRFHRIQRLPLHLRWEIYPVPHEGKRAEHGGSRLEETNWWDKPQSTSTWAELKFMLAEIIFIRGLYEYNRKLWYRSFPFHFGLYLTACFAFLLFLGAVLELAGITGSVPSVMGIGVLDVFTTAAGVAGCILGIVGAVSLLIMRVTSLDLKPYTNFSHIFNLLFILASLALLLCAWIVADRDFSLLRGYVASLLVLDVSAPLGSAWVGASVLTLSLLTAYIPLTHMSHFFVKWFTWHKIRWDDEPNVRGGRIEVLIQNALQAPVSWSANHVRANGKKNWADIATEEIEQ